jgi:hypothetical protein
VVKGAVIKKILRSKCFCGFHPVAEQKPQREPPGIKRLGVFSLNKDTISEPDLFSGWQVIFWIKILLGLMLASNFGWNGAIVFTSCIGKVKYFPTIFSAEKVKGIHTAVAESIPGIKSVRTPYLSKIAVK